MVLDLKQYALVDTPYLYAQISYSSDLEEDLQYPNKLLEAEHKVYCSMANNERDVKIKHPAHLYAK